MMVLPDSLSLKSTVSTTTKSCQSTEANATATKKKKQMSVERLELTKSYHANVACVLLTHKLQQMQDSSACIQLSKCCPQFSCPQAKTGHLIKSGAHLTAVIKRPRLEFFPGSRPINVAPATFTLGK